MKDTIPQLRQDIDRIERMTLNLYKRLDALEDKERGVDWYDIWVLLRKGLV